MSGQATVAKEALVAKKKSASAASDKPEKDRVEFKATPEFVARLERVAERIGLSVSAYLRMIATEDMDRREARHGKPADGE